MSRPWRLWIDDTRNPKNEVRYSGYGEDFKEEDFVWAQTREQAEYYVEMWGLPSFMALDHDLGYDGTTMEFLHWLQQRFPNTAPPPYRCHTANPLGKQNMISFLESWKKSVEVD
mgnify:CR=1 FL=1